MFELLTKHTMLRIHRVTLLVFSMVSIVVGGAARAQMPQGADNPEANQADAPAAHRVTLPPAPELDSAPVEPPPAVQEMVPESPSEGCVWVTGHWLWTGAQFKWLPGYWTPPKEGFEYIQPGWNAAGPHLWRFSKGGWTRIVTPIVVTPPPPPSVWPYVERVYSSPYAVYGGYYSRGYFPAGYRAGYYGRHAPNYGFGHGRYHGRPGYSVPRYSAPAPAPFRSGGGAYYGGGYRGGSRGAPVRIR